MSFSHHGYTFSNEHGSGEQTPDYSAYYSRESAGQEEAGESAFAAPVRLNYYGYDLELAEAETEEKSWRCLEYKLTREFNLVASGSYHENGPVDTTGESVLEHILAFRKDEKYSRQSKELDDVLEQLIQLRRKLKQYFSSDLAITVSNKIENETL